MSDANVMKGIKNGLWSHRSYDPFDRLSHEKEAIERLNTWNQWGQSIHHSIRTEASEYFDDFTWLHFAAENNGHEWAQLLVNQGAD